MFVERNMSELDSKLIIYYENLKRLRRSLEVAQQIHMAPVIYLSSVTEVARRKAFSENFLKVSQMSDYPLSRVFSLTLMTY